MFYYCIPCPPLQSVPSGAVWPHPLHEWHHLHTQGFPRRVSSSYRGAHARRVCGDSCCLLRVRGACSANAMAGSMPGRLRVRQSALLCSYCVCIHIKSDIVYQSTKPSNHHCTILSIYMYILEIALQSILSTPVLPLWKLVSGISRRTPHGLLTVSCDCTLTPAS